MGLLGSIMYHESCFGKWRKATERASASSVRAVPLLGSSWVVWMNVTRKYQDEFKYYTGVSSCSTVRKHGHVLVLAFLPLHFNRSLLQKVARFTMFWRSYFSVTWTLNRHQSNASRLFNQVKTFTKPLIFRWPKITKTWKRMSRTTTIRTNDIIKDISIQQHTHCIRLHVS